MATAGLRHDSSIRIGHVRCLASLACLVTAASHVNPCKPAVSYAAQGLYLAFPKLYIISIITVITNPGMFFCCRHRKPKPCYEQRTPYVPSEARPLTDS
jgi:hypothetical protein